MRPLRLRIIFEAVLGLVIITSLVVILRQGRRISELQRRQEADAQSLRLLQEAWKQEGLHKIPPEVTEETTTSDQAAIAKREDTIAHLDHQLAEANASIAGLQTALASANDQLSKQQASAQESLNKQQADEQAKVADLQKQVDAALAQAAIARQRTAAVEAQNAKLTEDAGAARPASDLSRTLGTLLELNRRRDTYLTSILRRYRDITSEFRAMSSMLDTSHDANRELNNGACSDAALSRIQNAVSSAEDDLRQISELNDRIQRLEKQLPKP